MQEERPLSQPQPEEYSLTAHGSTQALGPTVRSALPLAKFIDRPRQWALLHMSQADVRDRGEDRRMPAGLPVRLGHKAVQYMGCEMCVCVLRRSRGHHKKDWLPMTVPRGAGGLGVGPTQDVKMHRPDDMDGQSALNR